MLTIPGYGNAIIKTTLNSTSLLLESLSSKTPATSIVGVGVGKNEH
jgi:hypothetical protein